MQFFSHRRGYGTSRWERVASQQYHGRALTIDNSRSGAIHVLCDISRTKIAITSCDRSNKRAYFSACVGANGILMKFDLKKRQF